MQRQQAMLPVQNPEDARLLRDQELADASAGPAGFEFQPALRDHDHGPGYRRKILRVAAVLVVLEQLLDLPPNEGPLE
ncbi:MAG: hypothetical protein AAB253_01225 [candidate division NC10 bacterium]